MIISELLLVEEYSFSNFTKFLNMQNYCFIQHVFLFLSEYVCLLIYWFVGVCDNPICNKKIFLGTEEVEK